MRMTIVQYADSGIPAAIFCIMMQRRRSCVFVAPPRAGYAFARAPSP